MTVERYYPTGLSEVFIVRGKVATRERLRALALADRHVAAFAVFVGKDMRRAATLVRSILEGSTVWRGYIHRADVGVADELNALAARAQRESAVQRAQREQAALRHQMAAYCS